MPIMSNNEPIALKQIQEKLKVKQHVLIHLCEKGVIEPDLLQTEGRGVHREFSKRNLLEFAVALAIRRYGIPVLTTAAIIKLLRSFERATARRIKGFSLIQYLTNNDKNAALHLYLYEGTYLVFAASEQGKFLMIAGFDLAKTMAAKTKELPKIDSLESLPESFNSFLCLDLKKIAHKII